MHAVLQNACGVEILPFVVAQTPSNISAPNNLSMILIMMTLTKNDADNNVDNDDDDDDDEGEEEEEDGHPSSLG